MDMLSHQVRPSSTSSAIFAWLAPLPLARRDIGPGSLPKFSQCFADRFSKARKSMRSDQQDDDGQHNYQLPELRPHVHSPTPHKAPANYEIMLALLESRRQGINAPSRISKQRGQDTVKRTPACRLARDRLAPQPTAGTRLAAPSRCTRVAPGLLPVSDEAR